MSRYVLLVITLAACSSVAVERPVPRPSTAATLGIPPGHLPKAGECRIWVPGTPPGQQGHQRSRSCAGIARAAPSGSWIVYRPTRDKKLVHVRLVDGRRAGTMTVIRVYDADGRFLREERQRPDESFDEEERPRGGGKKR